MSVQNRDGSIVFTEAERQAYSDYFMRQCHSYKTALQYLAWGMFYEKDKHPELAAEIKRICEAALTYNHDFTAELFGNNGKFEPCRCKLCQRDTAQRTGPGEAGNA